ncbi:DNA polymerase III subunit delta [Cellulomonas denverensis]|uniref:DNA polymerase III subunit delta n=1 Tax=Cellulomonas denverensis TaxID=264297 RepID=UPI001A4B7D20|nr:DNA polymerase III subunit delta [Cellulomonas denverensis]GIG27344.1 DNA-binding protein [Cellulomonas denverensis]
MPAATSSRRPARGSTSAPAGLSWDEAELAPIILVSGPEALLAERAVDRLIGLARERDDAVEVTRIDGSAYGSGELTLATSPSLFAEDRLIVVENVEKGTDELIADAIAYVGGPAEDVVLILRHGGGQRGKKLLDTVKQAGCPVVSCEAMKRDADKATFVTQELRRAGRRMDARAVRALVDAVGSDLRELAAACTQLIADTTGVIGVEVVERYYGGRIEATGFRVADAAVTGSAGEAVSLLRHALATGVDPVPLVAALAARLRTLAKVSTLRGRGGGAEKDLGLAPWQIDRTRKELAHWTPETLAEAITAIAQADAEVKGASRDPQFAVERAVLRIARAASR